MARHFTNAEVIGLDHRLVDMLDAARDRAGVPFYITSGLRTMDANDAAGGVKESSHLRGFAVDLRCQFARDRFNMVAACIGIGFRRIGIYNAHIHVDVDETLPQDVIWTGESH